MLETSILTLYLCYIYVMLYAMLCYIYAMLSLTAFVVFSHSWSYGVLLWEMATLGI